MEAHNAVDQTIEVANTVLVDNDLVGFDDETPEWRRAFFQSLSGTAALSRIDPSNSSGYPNTSAELVRKAEAIADEVDQLRIRRIRARKDAWDEAVGEKLNKILDSKTGFRNRVSGEVLKLFTPSDNGTRVYFSGGWVDVADFDDLFEPVADKGT